MTCLGLAEHCRCVESGPSMALQAMQKRVERQRFFPAKVDFPTPVWPWGTLNGFIGDFWGGQMCNCRQFGDLRAFGSQPFCLF